MILRINKQSLLTLYNMLVARWLCRHKAPHQAQAFIQTATSQCVKCGMCLPHCPTYHLFQDESQSPRGRIALIQAVAQNDLPITTPLVQALDHCLGCGACEQVCPAQVPYTRLLHTARATLAIQAPLKKSIRWLLFCCHRPRRMRCLHWFLYLYQQSGLRTLLTRSGLIARVGLASLDQWHRSPYPRPLTRRLATGQGQRVQLFTGCVTSLDTPTLMAAHKCLTALDYQVSFSAQPQCCGALPAQAGQAQIAHACEQACQVSVKGQDHVISCASGCLKHMQATWDRSSPSLHDICDFLAQHPAAAWQWQPCHKRVALHTPCTGKARKSIIQLLQAIPGLQLSLVDWNFCCGAAGNYCLQQSATALRLREPLVQAVGKLAPDIVLTSNLGCALQLQQGLLAANSPILVQHPVKLLADCLR
jgi:glycolate oxidase iron-sulfur subunit